MIKFEHLRSFQRRVVTRFRGWTEAFYAFLIVALPGGGKTIAALFAAAEWLAAEDAKRRFVIVVVPTRNLKRQWRKEAKKRLGLELQTGEFAGTFKDGMNGCVVTYSALASDGDSPCDLALIFKRLCAKHDVLVIFDEVHHAGESRSWGDGIRHAFDSAAMRMALSGTPWRSDAGAISFLKRDPQTDEYEVHETFGWVEALQEVDPVTGDPRPVVRELACTPYHGSCDWKDKNTGELIRLDSRDDLSPEDIGRCLRGRLYERRYCEGLLRDADNKLNFLRISKPDAAGIVTCIDMDHAERVAGWIKAITGEAPFIAVSDDERASGDDPIEAFKAKGCTAKWIVSVRQISEGADIPRLMVGVYLTNFTTELFFRQFIGRIARNQGTEFDREAYLFYPDHPELNKYVAEILELQAVALAKRKPKDPQPEGTGGGVRGAGQYEFVSGSEAEEAGLVLPIVNKERLTPMQARSLRETAKRYRVSETTAAQIMRDHGNWPPGAGSDDADSEAPSDVDEEPLEVRLERMRKHQDRRISRWWFVIGKTRTHDHLNNEANDEAGIPEQTDPKKTRVELATEQQLKARGEYIEAQIRAAQNAA